MTDLDAKASAELAELRAAIDLYIPDDGFSEEPLSYTGDNSCCVASPKGMGTNGGCRCSERDLRRAVLVLKAQRRVYMANKENPDG